MGRGYGDMTSSWTGAIIMGLAMLIVAGVLAYFLFKTGAGGFGSTSHETPLDILKNRCARSEVTKDRFEQVKKDM